MDGIFLEKIMRAIMATISGINLKIGTEVLERCEHELENKIG